MLNKVLRCAERAAVRLVRIAGDAAFYAHMLALLALYKPEPPPAGEPLRWRY